MIDLYYWTTPNGHKITIFLEEAALPYSIADMASYPWIVPHERHKQKLDEFSNLNRWFLAIGRRPAVQRAYELAKTINTKPTVNEDSKSILFGQGRRSV